MREQRLLILFICLFIVMTGYGVTLPVLPFYIEKLAMAQGANVSKSSYHVGIITGIFALMQFFFAPLWGKLSDQLGRRPLFLFGLAGFGLSMAFFGMGTNLTMLYSVRILGGIVSAAVLPIANAYVADVTSEKDRGRGMAWLGSAISLGVVVGPALSAFLFRQNIPLLYRFWHFRIDGFSIPFFTAAMLSFLALGAAIRWLPEPLRSQEIEIRGKGSKSNVVHRPGFPARNIPGGLLPILSLGFLYQFALSLFEGTFALHAKHVTRFGPSEMGLVFIICGFVMASAQAFVVVRLIDRFGERPLLPTGFALMGIALVMLMTTQDLNIILIYVALLAFGVALIIPSLATLVSRRSYDKQGAALGQLIAANNLGQAFGPAIGGILFVWQIHAPYFLTAFLLLATAAYWSVRTKPLPAESR